IGRRFPAVRSRVRRVASGDPVKTVMNLAIEEKADVVVMANLVEPLAGAEDGFPGPAGPAVGPAPSDDPPLGDAKPAPCAADAHRDSPGTPRRRRLRHGALRNFYRDPLGWVALFATSLLLTYGGGVVLFWLHAIYRGEHGPPISDWSHWFLDSTLGFVALTPVLFFILPTALWLLTRGDGSRRLRLWSYVAVVGTMFTLVTGPGPLLHNAIAGHGTWVADLATVIFGHDAETAERNMHAMERSHLTEGLLQIAVGLPVYVALAWLALRLVKSMTGRRQQADHRQVGPSETAGTETKGDTR
ncbi:MAG: hypothetical protein M3450_14090, partial [Actinomycetota bacterium]|nr:hypothetical protein [Actinomycetota bacterium]